jgi:pimeloyl-ACP methyl ester carboxylesterase
MPRVAATDVRILRTLAIALAAGLALALFVNLTLFPPAKATSTSASTSAGLARYYAQKLIWHGCGGGMQCTTLSAPLDWGDPGGDSISLALIRHPATGKKLGSLLVNPGGPGASGVDFVANSVGNAVDASVAERYDIVGFDPRGVGASSAVDCYGDAALDGYLYGISPGAIGSDGWIDAQTKTAKAFIEACKKNTGPLLAHIDTTSVARDLDLERAALGESKITYLGYSYGTYLGTIYAGLFPHRVGRMVLDGAEDPWLDNNPADTAHRIDTSQEVAFESELRAYLAACLAAKPAAIGKGTCAFAGSPNVGEGMKAVARLLTTVGEHPIRNTDGRMLGSATLATAIYGDLYDPSQWSDLNALFASVQHGEAGTAFASSDSYNDRSTDGTYYDNSVEAGVAINCLEEGGNSNRSAMRRDAAALKKDAPVLGIYDAFNGITCGEWPYGPVAFPDPVTARGAAPILIVGSTGDPATPYAQAKALAHQLASGVLVTYHGDGHTAYNKGVACVDATVDAYLLAGTVPAKDPQCR